MILRKTRMQVKVPDFYSLAASAFLTQGLCENPWLGVVKRLTFCHSRFSLRALPPNPIRRDHEQSLFKKGLIEKPLAAASFFSFMRQGKFYPDECKNACFSPVNVPANPWFLYYFLANGSGKDRDYGKDQQGLDHKN